MSKYLEYTRYANTGVTKGVAPVLGKFLNRDKLALEALCEEIRLNGGSPMDSETLLYILSGTIDYLREQFATKCVRYRFFGITFEVACYGPFETADAKFDPAVNSLEVAVRLGEDLKNCLVNETPTLVTEETASTARIYRAMDIASGALGIIIGTRSFRVTGRNVYVSREGESLKLMDGKGRVYDLIYDRIESPQRVECHLAENLNESGTCKLILTTYAGDDSEGAKLGIYERVVNFVKFVEPPVVPTVDSVEVVCLGEPEMGYHLKVHGENLRGVEEGPEEFGGYPIHALDAKLFTPDGDEVALTPDEGAANVEVDRKLVNACMHGEDRLADGTGYTLKIVLADTAGNPVTLEKAFTYSEE